ncbi:hypothetical protein AAFF_G00044740 [Aldrovandia affinis]|uniref:Uncharacterized protein n=1 Tax=Aldrovandia affinis TaxID=143900 RepID=A0AAD7S4J2_9TELE|nr:hypothetical protein AAFF_G00044740 [Aldrovandia affinis]
MSATGNGTRFSLKVDHPSTEGLPSHLTTNSHLKRRYCQDVQHQKTEEEIPERVTNYDGADGEEIARGDTRDAKGSLIVTYPLRIPGKTRASPAPLMQGTVRTRAGL